MSPPAAETAKAAKEGIKAARAALEPRYWYHPRKYKGRHPNMYGIRYFVQFNYAGEDKRKTHVWSRLSAAINYLVEVYERCSNDTCDTHAGLHRENPEQLPFIVSRAWKRLYDAIPPKYQTEFIEPHCRKIAEDNEEGQVGIVDNGGGEAPDEERRPVYAACVISLMYNIAGDLMVDHGFSKESSRHMRRCATQELASVFESFLDLPFGSVRTWHDSQRRMIPLGWTGNEEEVI